MSSVADALSSASMLLAALALVYSAWSGSIDAEANRMYSAERNTKVDEQKETKLVRDRRAWPMAMGCWLIVAAFAPRDFDILGTVLACAQRGGCAYDDVAAIFLLTQLLVLGLALHLSGRIRALNTKLAA